MRAKAGDTLDVNNTTITAKDAAGAPLPLDTYDSGKFLIKNKLSDPDSAAVLSFDSTLGQLVLQSGSFYLVRAAADTKKRPKKYEFCFKVYSGLVEITALEGFFIFEQEGID